MYKTLIVDDQKVSRQFLEMITASCPEFEVVFSLSTADIADTYVAAHDINLVIMDVVMADGSNGLTAAQRIKKIKPEVKIIMVTSMPDFSFIETAKNAGCEGFWYKEYGEIQLQDVMRRIMNGETVYPDEAPDIMIGRMKSSDLSENEIEILRGIVNGCSNKEISEATGVSIQTIKNRISGMLIKTGFANRTALALEVSKSGYIVANGKIK